MVANHRVSAVAALRAQLTVIVLPIQLLVDKPIQFFHWLGTSISTQQEILGENATLRARQMILQAKLQRLLSLERENAQLRELLSSSSHLSGRTLVGQLLAVSSDPMLQEVTINKGGDDGVFVGQPVLDAYGLMGQVISTTTTTSQVLLVTDDRSAIPVEDARNGVRSILAGSGYADELHLLHIPVTVDVAVGDTLITSGLGGRFPSGYPVGVVAAINRTAGERFSIVTVKPSAHVDRSRQVILIWPAETPAPVAPAAPTKKTASATDGKKAKAKK